MEAIDYCLLVSFFFFFATLGLVLFSEDRQNKRKV